MKSAWVALIALHIGTAPGAVSQQTVAEEMRGEVETAVRAALAAEGAAFAAADCAVAMSFFADWQPLFVVSGRTMNRPQLVQMCAGMAGPRPGPARVLAGHAVNVLSATAAFSVTHYTVTRTQPDGASREAAQVVTKVWVKGPQGWRIVHFHESIGGA